MDLLIALALTLQDSQLRDLGRRAADEAATKLGKEREALAEKDSRSFNARGMEMIRRGNGLGAKYCFGSALAADAANVSAAANLGFTLLRIGEIDGAEAVLSLASKMHPDCAEVLNNYAWVLAERGRFSDALKLLEACREIYSAHPQLDYGRAWLLEKLGRAAEAKDLAGEVVALYPKHEEAQVLFKRLEGVKIADPADEGPFGEKEPKDTDIAAFVVEQLRRRDELVREVRAVLQELLGLSEKEERREAEDERLDEEREKKREGLQEKMLAGDKEATKLLGEMMQEDFDEVVYGMGERCSTLENPHQIQIHLDDLDVEDNGAPSIQELREKKSEFTIEDAQAALSYVAEAFRWKIQYSWGKIVALQHERVCRAAFPRVRAKVKETRAALAKLKEEYDDKLSKLRLQYEAHLITEDEYKAESEKLTNEYTARCRTVLFGWRAWLAGEGNAWKTKVDRERDALRDPAKDALGEHEKRAGRFYELFGRTKPTENELTLLDQWRQTMAIADQYYAIGGPMAVLFGLHEPDRSGIQFKFFVAAARKRMEQPPPKIVFTIFGYRWAKDAALAWYLYCLMVFSPDSHRIECPGLDKPVAIRDIVNALGWEFNPLSGRFGMFDVSVGLDGTVNVGIGNGSVINASVNLRTGKYGVKGGYEHEIFGGKAGLFLTLDEKGLGWAGEAAMGKKGFTLGGDTLWEIPKP